MYALNIKKGTTIQHPEITLKGGVAVPVSDKLAVQLKNIINIIVFDRVAGREDSDKKPKHLYNINPNSLQEEK